ncbi:MAG: hypothetical protein CMJ27_04395 [Phycisphaerae bacterium]|nr:hypothetical protein [Phycisphaerae bacterium]
MAINNELEDWFARYNRRTMVLSEVSCGVRWSTRGGGLPRRDGVHSDGRDPASTAGAGATGGASI